MRRCLLLIANRRGKKFFFAPSLALLGKYKECRIDFGPRNTYTTIILVTYIQGANFVFPIPMGKRGVGIHSQFCRISLAGV